MTQKLVYMLDISYYLRVPAFSGGALRILQPLMKIKDDDGVRVDLLFASPNDAFTAKVQQYVEACPAIMSVVGVCFPYDINESVACPEDLSKDVWQTISKPLVEKALDMLSQIDYDIIQLEHSQMTWLAPILKWKCPKAQIVLDLHNVEYLLYKRWLKYETSIDAYREIEEKYRLLRDWEMRSWPWVDAALSVSPIESEIFTAATNNKLVWDVPTGGGVNLEKYAPSNPNREKPYDLLYLGTMEWFPNSHGMIWFIQEVFPKVLKRLPNTNLHIVGFGKPNDQLMALAKQGINITFWGEQKDDVAFFQKSKVFIVPLFIAAGARVKILTAWASQIPIVSTTVGAEGLNYTREQDILIADEPEAFAQAVVRLLETPRVADEIACNAYHLVETEYSSEVCVSRLVDIYHRLAEINSNTNNDAG